MENKIVFGKYILLKDGNETQFRLHHRDGHIIDNIDKEELVDALVWYVFMKKTEGRSGVILFSKSNTNTPLIPSFSLTRAEDGKGIIITLDSEIVFDYEEKKKNEPPQKASNGFQKVIKLIFGTKK